MADLEPVNGAAVDEGGEFAEASAEGLSDWTHGQYNVELLSHTVYKEVKERQRGAVSLLGLLLGPGGGGGGGGNRRHCPHHPCMVIHVHVHKVFSSGGEEYPYPSLTSPKLCKKDNRQKHLPVRSKRDTKNAPCKCTGMVKVVTHTA